jgi:hypothetical protein
LGVEEELHHIVHHPSYIIASKWVRKTILLLHHIVHHPNIYNCLKMGKKKIYFLHNAKVLTPPI